MLHEKISRGDFPAFEEATQDWAGLLIWVLLCPIGFRDPNMCGAGDQWPIPWQHLRCMGSHPMTCHYPAPGGYKEMSSIFAGQ